MTNSSNPNSTTPTAEQPVNTATIKEFMSWLYRDFGHRINVGDHVEFVSQGGEANQDGSQADTLTIRLYTATNRYTITAKHERPPMLGNHDASERRWRGYLGCVATSRVARAGEHWHRGNDLPDGPLTEATWQAILATIVAYEMVKVHHGQLDRSGVVGYMIDPGKYRADEAAVNRRCSPDYAAEAVGPIDRDHNVAAYSSTAPAPYSI